MISISARSSPPRREGSPSVVQNPRRGCQSGCDRRKDRRRAAADGDRKLDAGVLLTIDPGSRSLVPPACPSEIDPKSLRGHTRLLVSQLGHVADPAPPYLTPDTLRPESSNAGRGSRLHRPASPCAARGSHLRAPRPLKPTARLPLLVPIANVADRLFAAVGLNVCTTVQL